ncbi:MAG: sodium:solute symporter family protein, partial [Bacteroidota bacterium]|nr:sodium:solute symporter family protein [Bacteroidota bacterium]
IGLSSLILASYMTNVLELMLYSYAFMVSGLFIPILVALYGKRPNSLAAIFAMIIGGATTVGLAFLNIKLPFDLDANIFGISASAIVYFVLNKISNIRGETG